MWVLGIDGASRVIQQVMEDTIHLNVYQAIKGKTEQIGNMSFEEALAAVSNEELVLV